MNSVDLMEKATRAVASARLLLAAGDVDGACNRAYYGMFDAGRAALMWAHAPVDASIAKTHSGLISAFGLHLVKTGKVPIELGKSLNRAAEIRLIADYSGDEVSLDHARWLVEQAESFVHAMRQTLASATAAPAPRL